VVVEDGALVVVVPAISAVVVTGSIVVVVETVVVVMLVMVVLDGATPDVVVVVFGLVVVVAVAIVLVAGMVVGGATIVVVVGWARGTAGPIPLERDGGFVVGTGTVGTGTVGAGTVGAGAVVVGAAIVGVVVGAAIVGVVVVGGVVVGGVVVGGIVVGGVVVGGAYLDTVVTCVLEVDVVVVRAVITVWGRVVVVVLVEPVGRTGTSACAMRTIEPNVLLSLAFWASSLVSRSSWTARSCFSASTAAASLAVDRCAARGAGAFPRMAFEARSMYCLALAESCLAR
jgi:hypothetical protein